MKTTLAVLTLACGLAAPAVQAQEMYIGQIFMTGANFCPRLTAEANGQILPIAENQALFSLVGTMYGGDGRTTFALPDLRGRIAMHSGQGPGLGPVTQGQAGGRTSQTLAVAQMPAHSHGAKGTPSGVPTPGNSPSPAGGLPALTPTAPAYATPGGTVVDMAPGSVAVTVDNAGGGQPFDITNPYLGLKFCVVLQGIYPSRS
ncbi:phage tail protein [Tropicimonas sp. IMCC34043]|uniref:phage tail protein n=1 Tax=Tropicimonas sp. IMCC34043 TaxID=2248760 RepID=UPI000E27547A|nr:tail fiber protein [Tropicimonas sp. IMCC34043]